MVKIAALEKKAAIFLCVLFPMSFFPFLFFRASQIFSARTALRNKNFFFGPGFRPVDKQQIFDLWCLPVRRFFASLKNKNMKKEMQDGFRQFYQRLFLS